MIAAIWLVLVGWLTLWPFLNWWTTHFVITDRRVMFRHGVLTRTGIDIPLARINSVEFRHGLIDRMLRTGTLVIESAPRIRWNSTTFPAWSACTHCFITKSSTPWVPKSPTDREPAPARRRRRAGRRSGVTLKALVPAVVGVLHGLGDTAGGEGGLDGLLGAAPEFVGEYPAAECPEPERHLQQVADDVGGDEVGDVLDGQADFGYAQIST